LPARGIVGEVGIEERIPKPVFTFTPIDQQMFHEERRNDHPHAVMHETGAPVIHAYRHRRSDNRSCQLPGSSECVLSFFHGNSSKSALDIDAANILLIEQEMIRKFAPAELS